jgi:hypothetical protein
MRCAPPALRRCPVVGGLFVHFFLLGLLTLFTFIPISTLILILALSPAFSLSLGLLFISGKPSASGAIDSALDSLSGSTETSASGEMSRVRIQWVSLKRKKEGMRVHVSNDSSGHRIGICETYQDHASHNG